MARLLLEVSNNHIHSDQLQPVASAVRWYGALSSSKHLFEKILQRYYHLTFPKGDFTMHEQNVEKTLTDMKLPLVLRDYESWNQAASNVIGDDLKI